MDGTAGLVRAEWEVTHDGAHRNIFNSHDALCVWCSRRFQEETRGAASPILPEETWPPCLHPRTISMTHVLWPGAPHSRIPSGSLSHTNPNRSPSSIRHLSSITKNSLLYPLASSIKSYKAKCPWGGLAMQRGAGEGRSGGESFSHHQKTAAKQQTTAASRDPPSLCLSS